MARFFTFLLFVALFFSSDAIGIKNRDEEISKVRTKKHLTKLPRKMMSASSLSQSNNRDLQKTVRDLKLGDGEIKAMFGFSHSKSTKSSKSDSDISVDGETFFLVALLLFFFALFFGAGTSPTSPSTPSPTHLPTMDPVGSLSLPTASPTISSAPSISTLPTL